MVHNFWIRSACVLPAVLESYAYGGKKNHIHSHGWGTYLVKHVLEGSTALTHIAKQTRWLPDLFVQPCAAGQILPIYTIAFRDSSISYQVLQFATAALTKKNASEMLVPWWLEC